MLHGSRSGFRSSSTSCRHGGVRFDRCGSEAGSANLLRERLSLWSSLPSVWCSPRPPSTIGIVVAVGHADRALPDARRCRLVRASVSFALILDWIKRPVEAAFKVA
jgi:hypothetical protein